MDGQPFTKQKIIVWLTPFDFGGTYRVKTYIGKGSAWYMKVILQYHFADAQINWPMGWQNLPAYIRYWTFDIL